MTIAVLLCRTAVQPGRSANSYVSTLSSKSAMKGRIVTSRQLAFKTEDVLQTVRVWAGDLILFLRG